MRLKVSDGAPIATTSAERAPPGAQNRSRFQARKNGASALTNYISAYREVRRIVPGSRRIKMVPAPSRITFLRTGRCALRLPDTFNRTRSHHGSCTDSDDVTRSAADGQTSTHRKDHPQSWRRAGDIF